MKGEKTRKVTLKKRTVTKNEIGEEIDSWDENDKPIYAEFLERHGKEGDVEGQIMVIQDTRCKVRYQSQLDPRLNDTPEADHRIQDGGITYDVTSIIPQGRRDKQLLMLERRDND